MLQQPLSDTCLLKAVQTTVVLGHSEFIFTVRVRSLHVLVCVTLDAALPKQFQSPHPCDRVDACISFNFRGCVWLWEQQSEGAQLMLACDVP